MVEDELGSENEENSYPYEDANMIDCEDYPNDGGEDTEAANILGEFDDGYWEMRDFKPSLLQANICATLAALLIKF